MEWKKIASMEYGKIVFHSIPHHVLCVCIVQKAYTLTNANLSQLRGTLFPFDVIMLVCLPRG